MKNTSKLILVIGTFCLSLLIVLFFYNNGIIGNKSNKGSGKSIDASELDSLPPAFKAALVSLYNKEPQMGSDSLMHTPDASTSISIAQGMCIYNLCLKVKAQKTLEIGMAYGYSTLYFLAAVNTNGVGHHTAMDPFEISDWHGIALQKVKELGMDSSFQYMKEYDIFGLPDLARQQQKFDVIFIDGNHRYDDVLIDFSLSDYICADNGYVILHDVWMPSIKKVVGFIRNNRSDYELMEDLDAPYMAVFKKTGVDKRPWNHFQKF